MNVERFLRDYARTAQNLPGVLAQWRQLSPDLREHYADELALMLARRAEVLAGSGTQGGSVAAVLAMAWRDGQVIAYRGDVMDAMGFDPLELILSSASMDAVARDTGTVEVDSAPFQLQALAA